MNRPSDADRYLAGDPESIAELRAAVAWVVRRFGFSAAGREEELVQEVLGRVFMGLAEERYRAEATLITYAENVAKYTCLEAIRHQRRFKTLDQVEPASRARWANPEESLLLDEVHRRNLRVLEELPEECRQLFALVFVERLSYRAVAEKLGVSEVGLRVRIFRCRLRCARLIPRRIAERKPAATAGPRPGEDR